MINIRSTLVTGSFLLLLTYLNNGYCDSQMSGQPPADNNLPRMEVPTLGSKANPVRCDMPRGEREYLARLRCENGHAPAFARMGSVGPGTDKHILDLYMIRCEDNHPVDVYMDMYHGGHREMVAIARFTILPELVGRLASGCPPTLSDPTYILTDVEVSKPARFLGDPPSRKSGMKGRISVEFVVDTEGKVELGSVRIISESDERLRAAGLDFLRQVRFEPAEHTHGCKVKQRLGVALSFE